MTTRRGFLHGTLVLAGAAAVSEPGELLAVEPQGRLAADLEGPWGLSYSAAGDLYVADPGAYRIRVFDANGGFKRSFGKAGSGDGCLNYPTGLHVQGDEVFICDTNNGRIAVFDLEGGWVGSMGGLGIATEKLASPNGVWAGERWVWVANTRGHVVQRYARATRAVDRVFGVLGDDAPSLPQGTTDYKLRLPAAVAADGDGRVFLLDSKHARVVALDEEGALFWESTPVVDGAGLVRPMGIAVAGESLYVADTGNDRVVKLDRLGRTIGALTGVLDPHGLAVCSGRLAIAQRKPGAVRVVDAF